MPSSGSTIPVWMHCGTRYSRIRHRTCWPRSSLSLSILALNYTRRYVHVVMHGSRCQMSQWARVPPSLASHPARRHPHPVRRGS